MQSISCECQIGWITSWNQDYWEKYQQPQTCRWYHSNGQKRRGTKDPSDEGEKGEWKSWYELKIQKMKIMGIRSLQFSHSFVSDSLWPLGLQHVRLPRPSPTPGAYSNSCPLSRWCHPTISSSVVPFSSLPQSLPASGSFPMSQLFTSGGQSIGVLASASVLPMNIQDWFLLGWTGWISLHSKGLSRVFSNSTVQKHQFFYTQTSLWSNSHIYTWPPEKP